jgi:cytoskeletal protein RodZ
VLIELGEPTCHVNGELIQALHGAISMKQRIPVVFSFLSIGLLLAGSALAQAQNQPAPSQSTQSMPSSQSATQPSTSPTNPTSPAASSSTAGTAGDSATYNTSQGQLTVKSSVPAAQPTGSPPSFEQLANGKKYITKDDANAYPPLANDFLYASHNGNRISKAQYERWLKDLK